MARSTISSAWTIKSICAASSWNWAGLSRFGLDAAGAAGVLRLPGLKEQQSFRVIVLPVSSSRPRGELRRYLRSSYLNTCGRRLLQISKCRRLPTASKPCGAGHCGAVRADKEEPLVARNEAERIWPGSWRGLLKVDQVGIEQNFFDLAALASGAAVTATDPGECLSGVCRT